MRRGQFFSLDVFIASLILVTGGVVLLFSVFGQTSLQQAQLFSSDLLRETLTKTVRDLNYPILNQPYPAGYASNDPYGIKNFDMTLGALIGEYYELNQTAATQTERTAYGVRLINITRHTIAPLISDQYSYSISIINATDPTERRVLSERVRLPRSRAQYTVAARSIVSGIDRNRRFFGPYTLEVLVWN